jgi:hypothetical protein
MTDAFIEIEMLCSVKMTQKIIAVPDYLAKCRNAIED